MKRRIATILLTMVVLLSALSGCGKGTGKKDSFNFSGMEIVIATPYTDSSPGWKERMDKVRARIPDVEKQYNVKISIETITDSEYWDGMVTTAMGGKPYGDLMFSFPWTTADWVKGGIVRDVSGIAKDVGIDFSEESWNRLVIDDNTYGKAIYGFERSIPEVQFGLLYNKQMFENEGLKDPNELIDEGGAWNFSVLEEYAQKLTKPDASGKMVQWGLASSDLEMLMYSFVQSNGGRLINYDKNPPEFSMGEPKSLAALEVFNRMMNTDKTIQTGVDWQTGAENLAGGTLGMYLCEQWVIEYIRDYVASNNLETRYGLTYFPIGPSGDDFVDTSFGGNSMFIPSSISEEKAKAALLVYAALYAPEEDETREDTMQFKAESLFQDEESVKVYNDIVLKGRAKSTGVNRLGLTEIMDMVSGYFIDGMGTPQSIINEFAPEVEGLIADSSYVSVIKEQKK